MKRLFVSVALMVLVTLVGMVGVGSAADDEIQTVITLVQNIQTAVQGSPPTANTGVSAERKNYYLTVASFAGGDAVTACDSGFHMASLSEVQDPSKVQYASGHTAAYNSRPPIDQYSQQHPDHIGWVQTEADPATGFGINCDIWKSSSDQQSGTTMTRRSLWGENNGHSLYEESDPAAWWQSTGTAPCSQPEPVWCVAD